MGIELPLDPTATGQADDVFYCRYAQHPDRHTMRIFTTAEARIPLDAHGDDPPGGYNQDPQRDEWVDIYTDIVQHNRDGSVAFPSCPHADHTHHPADCDQCLNPSPGMGEDDDDPADDDDPVDPVEGCDQTNLHVQVLNAETGDPIEGVTVTVSGQADQTTDANGWAKWRPIDPGTYAVSARKLLHDPDPARAPAVEVPAGETVETALELTPFEIHLHLDADRDGVVDDDWTNNAPWTPGAGNFGAIVFFNNDNDDDDAAKERDFENDVVDTARDEADFAPLHLRRIGPLPPNVTAELRVIGDDRLRVMKPARVGGTPIIKRGVRSHDFDNAALGTADIAMGMEALRYPQGGFDGKIKLHLTVKQGGATAHWEEAEIRVAPWIIFNHRDVTEKVYIASTADNGPIRTAIRTVLTSAGYGAGDLVEAPNRDFGMDRWMQDGMEPGFAAVPASGAGGVRATPATLRTALNRGLASHDPASPHPPSQELDTFPKRRLLGPDYGFLEALSPTLSATSLDSFGNLECSPPFRHRGRPGHPGRYYPFGRMIFGGNTQGNGGPSRTMHPKVKDLLRKQVLQSPIEIDTNWLSVGHVDEFISFLPHPDGTHGWKVLIAAPVLALNLTLAEPNNTPLFHNANLTRPHIFGSSGGRIKRFFPYRKVGKIRRRASFQQIQHEAQAIIDVVRQGELRDALDLVDDDFIHIPVLFTKSGSRYVAYTAGSVNMLVITRAPNDLHLCVPKPYGPHTAAGCVFEADISAKLNYANVSAISYIDDLQSYHCGQGELHCGTNSQRTPNPFKWWDLPWI